ncbi:hypothetical protein [Scytonema sp. PCC 10023]|uniref:hypothetical protein n=1 Tax=Scytonema sp. PCC 10023 TaxID=1680591 RepID=UPI0039C6B67C
MEKNKRVATLLNPPNSFVGTPSAFCLRTSAFLKLQGLHIAALHFAVFFIFQNQMPIFGKLRQELKENLIRE